ncbi:MAG: LysR family transcriptional regulator [Pseudomonadota bacterium]
MPDLRSLSLKQLRAYAAVIRSGSVTQAAQQLSLTAPAISNHLKTLEALAGGPLVDRSGDGAAPTALGRPLLRIADEVEAAIERGELQLRALKQGAEGCVVLAVVSTAKYFAPQIVAAFGRAFPRVKVTLSVGNRGEIIAGLERNAYDLVIMGRPPAHIEVERIVLGDHPHVLIAPPGDPLIDDPEVLPEDLMARTFLAREEGSGTRMLTNRFLERLGGGRPFEIVEMGSNETIKQAVIAGLGVAIISEHTCGAELAERRLATIAMTSLPIVRQWYLLSRMGRPLDDAARSLRDFIRERRADLLPAPVAPR